MPLIGISLDAATTAPTTGDTITFDVPHVNISMQTHSTGAGVSYTAFLQGSIDGVNFDNITSTSTDGIVSAGDIAVIAVRTLLTAISGTTPTVTATIAAA